MHLDENLEARLQAAGYEERLPSTDEEADAVDELLAKEINQLSLQEKDVVAFDVHGISQEIEETPKLILESLENLKRDLKRIHKKASYEKALAMNPEYVNDPSFLVMFLRAERFHCWNAARRLVLHFEKKECMFGPGDVLGRDVRLEDFNQEDLDELKSGFLQVLPSRDAAGRAVFCYVTANWSGKTRPKSIVSYFLPLSRYYWRIPVDYD